MSALARTLKGEFRDKETRHVYCDEFLNASIATQIKVLREQRHLTQSQLAEMAGLAQRRIAALEDVNYSSWTINVLRRLAEALDLALTIQFESFGEKLTAIEEFGRESLERPSFDNDPVFKAATTSAFMPSKEVQKALTGNGANNEGLGLGANSTNMIEGLANRQKATEQRDSVSLRRIEPPLRSPGNLSLSRSEQKIWF